MKDKLCGGLPCKICGKKTPNIFNINFEQVSICENCACKITSQQVKEMVYERLRPEA